MPRSPKKPCKYPGCPKLTRGGYCLEHQRMVDKAYEQYGRDKESKKRYGYKWRKIRSRFLQAHPLCEQCKKEGPADGSNQKCIMFCRLAMVERTVRTISQRFASHATAHHRADG